MAVLDELEQRQLPAKAQLLENLAALEQPPLSEADLIRIDSYSK